MDEKLYGEYEKLLLDRDAKRKEAGVYRTLFTAEFGELINKAFEIKIECIKKKKSIAFCQMYVNRGEMINATQLDAYIQDQMADYTEQLAAMIEDYNGCKNAGVSTELSVIRAKNIYRRIVKLIHPDINPIAAENDIIKDLWERTVNAYHKNNDDELKELEVLVYKALEDLDMMDSHPEIENIEERIERVKEEIEQIISTDPYQYKNLLDDSEAVELKKKQLRDEIDEYTRYDEELDKILKELMKNGVVMIWQPN